MIMLNTIRMAGALVAGISLPMGALFGSVELKALMHQRDQARHHVVALRHRLQVPAPTPTVTVTTRPRHTATPTPSPSGPGPDGSAPGATVADSGGSAVSSGGGSSRSRPVSQPAPRPPSSGSSGSGGSSGSTGSRQCPAGRLTAAVAPLGVLPVCVTIRSSGSVG